MAKKIVDAFTDLKVSRQRKYQMRQHANGKCITCGKPQLSSHLCQDCLIVQRERLRRKNNAQRRNLAAISYTGVRAPQAPMCPHCGQQMAVAA